jgi:uncharacterized membrane protein YdbT with pleckstrin-like domain
LGYVESVLEPGERIIHRAYLHWVIFFRPLALLLGGILALLVADEGPIASLIAVVLIFGGALTFIRAAIDRWTTEIAVTDQRVILKRGFIRRDTIEMNLPKVESVDVRQSIFGRVLDYGTVIVRGTGGSPNPLAYVSAPLALRRAVRLTSTASASTVT